MWCDVMCYKRLFVFLSASLSSSLRVYVCLFPCICLSFFVHSSIRLFVYSSVWLYACCAVLCAVCVYVFVCLCVVLFVVCVLWLVGDWLVGIPGVGWLIGVFVCSLVCMSYCLTVCDVFDACISPGVCIIILMYDELWHYVNWCMYVPCVPVCLCANVCMYVCHVCDWLCVYVRSTHVIVIVFDSWYHLSCGWHLRTPDFDCLTPDYWLTLALND